MIITGEKKKATDALAWFRGSDESVTQEINEIEKAHIEAERTGMGICKKRNMKPTGICFGLMFFQQMSGINAVIYNTVEIFLVL